MRSHRTGWVWMASCAVVLAACLVPEFGAGQGRRVRDPRGARRYPYADAFQGRDRTLRHSWQRPRQEVVVPDPSECYKDGANLNLQDVRLDFANTGFKWPQPGGPGSAVTITYSYSNLLDGQLQGLSAAQLKQAVEESLTVWASYAPLHFVEVVDAGPVPTSADTNYVAADRPQIRFGHHTIDGTSGPSLAHAYLPYSEDEGLAGDVHFDRDEDWSGAGGGFFLEVVLHEVGHSLGLDHEVNVTAIMNPVIANRFAALGEAYLLEDDVAGIRDIYGQGVGSLTPLEEPDEEPNEEPGDEEPDEEVPGDEIGDVTVTVDSETGTLIIAGDALDNDVLLTSWWWGTWVIGLNETTVNGKHWDSFRLHRGDIFCELGSGNDSLKTYGLQAATLECNLGEGDDRLEIFGSTIDDLMADGGTGQDSMKRLWSWIKSISAEGFESDVVRRWWWRWFWWR